MTVKSLEKWFVIFDSDITHSSAYVNVAAMTFVERYQELRGMNDDKNVRTSRPDVFHAIVRKHIQPRAPGEAQEI